MYIVYNDAAHNMEHQLLTPLVAPDLSAAFDTVNHDLLISVLENCFGVTGQALSWIESYLSERSFQVCINQSQSLPVKISCSVPQGSICGPVFFTCYTSTLSRCVSGDISVAGYADDHSIYIYIVSSKQEIPRPR